MADPETHKTPVTLADLKGARHIGIDVCSCGCKETHVLFYDADKQPFAYAALSADQAGRIVSEWVRKETARTEGTVGHG